MQQASRNGKNPRKRLRLERYDYSDPGAYFVTLCAADRQCLFGQVRKGRLSLLPPGQMVASWWLSIEERFPMVTLDQWIVMPDHLHGILWLGDRQHTELPPGTSLSRVIQWFKTMTTSSFLREVQQGTWPAVPNGVWQRSFHDRIIRTDLEIRKVRRYIITNPERWQPPPL